MHVVPARADPKEARRIRDMRRRRVARIKRKVAIAQNRLKEFQVALDNVIPLAMVTLTCTIQDLLNEVHPDMKAEFRASWSDKPRAKAA